MGDFVKRRIRDNLHGSIDINTLEDEVITHPYFQRLRRVKQTAFLSFVFPGASHTRFEHSLGVMHLAGRAWRKIIANQKRLKNSTSFFLEKKNQDGSNISETFPHLEKMEKNEYCYQALRLAALFHDVGHSALSHTGETFMPLVGEFLKKSNEIPEYLKSYLLKEGHQKKISHEIYSILILDKILKDSYKNLDARESVFVDPQDVASLINPSINLTENSQIKILKVQHILHELISGEVDCDRMDYLLRDSKECGVVYGVFDIDRIMDSFSMFYEPLGKSFHLALKLSGLPAFEDFLRARQSMYLQVYLHKTSTAGDSMLCSLSRELEGACLPSSHKEYCELDDYNIPTFFKEKIEEKNISEAEKRRKKNLVDDLFFKRNLWKSVYETTFLGERKKHPKEINLIQKYLEESKSKYEIIYHKSSLTKIKQGKRESSLKIIHKDHKMRYEISELGQYSTPIEEINTRHIVRIYVEGKVKKEEIIRLLN